MKKKAAALLAVTIALFAYAHAATERHHVSTSSPDLLASQATDSLAATTNEQVASPSKPAALGALPARTITSANMTLDGLAAQLAADTSITVEQARQWIEANPSAETGANDQARYVVFTSFFHASDTFTPYLKLYCEIEQDGANRSIKRIISYHLVHVFGNLNKPFAGYVDVILAGQHTIQYVVNGDFYEQGITSAQSHVNQDGLMRLTYSITGSTNWYAYVYSEQDITYSE